MRFSSSRVVFFLVASSCGASWTERTPTDAPRTRSSLGEIDSNELPSVSMVSSLYGFYDNLGPNLVRNMMRSTYEGDIELVVLQESEESNTYLTSVKLGDAANYLGKHKREIRYIHSPVPIEKIRQGAERNCLNLVARNDIVLNIDADDFYMPDYVSATVKELMREDVQNTMVQPCNKLPAVLVNESGNVRDSPVYGLIEVENDPSVRQIRERDYVEACKPASIGFGFAVPRFFVSKDEGLNIGLPGNYSGALPRFETQLDVNKKPIVTCLESFNDHSLPMARYAERLMGGEEGDFQFFLFLTGQGKIGDVSETIERCKQSVFSKVKNYCEALEEKYAAVQNGTAEEESTNNWIDMRMLVNPGIASLSLYKEDGSPLAIKTDTELSLTRKVFHNEEYQEEQNTKSRNAVVKYLQLAHYFVARTAGSSGNLVDFYGVDGNVEIGNAEIVEGLKKYWCNDLDDGGREWVVNMFTHANDAGSRIPAELNC